MAVHEITAVIVDDEPLARRRLARLLEREPDVRISAQCEDGTEAVQAIREQRPDIAFVDVRMPGMDGFETLQALGRDLPWIVFVTAFAEYAVRAFEVRALDYLLKPVDPDRLAETMARIRGRNLDESSSERREQLPDLIEAILHERKELQEALDKVPGRYGERLLLKDGPNARFIRIGEIQWIEADGNYVCIHTAKDKHLIRRTISELEKTLDPNQFCRIHRSTIVNLEYVDRLSPAFSGAYYVHMKTRNELVLSRGYRSKLFGRIGRDL
ncbi:LytR/AlgR family response regulator transcription factor [Gemmatimonadota bacterium]